MKKSKYIIRRGDGKFWVSPGRWSDEYPDAFIFEGWKNAVQEAIDSTPLFIHGASQIIADYGLDAERVVMTVQPTILGETA